MLGPDERAVLRELLRPPVGSELEFAVATTFTLDLTAALVAPLAFASFDLGQNTDPIGILEAIRSSAQKVAIFCQVGQVRVPNKASDLMAFLEPMIHEVQPRMPGYLFHPKVWVLRYVDEDMARSYRLICGTRNLTDDVSWDAVISLDGRADGVRRKALNRPLADFVRALPTLAVRPVPAELVRRTSELADEVATVEWELPDRIGTLEFHALGVSSRDAGSRLRQALAGTRTLVVSPFLDDQAVNTVRDDTNDLTVVSRVDALERLEPATLEGLSCRVVSPLAGLAADDDGALEDAPRTAGGILGGLHAKVYVVEHGRQAWALIGSANATSAGHLDRNVEFLVELGAGRSVLGVDQFLGADADFVKILEEYEPTGGAAPTIEDEVRRELERLLRRLASRPLDAHIVATEEGWIETVTGTTSSVVPPDARFDIGLLTLPGTAVEQTSAFIGAEFLVPAKADLTPFVILRVSQAVGADRIERSTIVRATLHGDPADRLDEVLARQVNSPDKFLRFVALLLGLSEDPLAALLEPTGGGDPWAFAAGSKLGLFEMLVRAVADQPRAIDDLDRLVIRLQATERGRGVLPPGFDDLWQVVRGAHARVCRR